MFTSSKQNIFGIHVSFRKIWIGNDWRTYVPTNNGPPSLTHIYSFGPSKSTVKVGYRNYEDSKGFLIH